MVKCQLQCMTGKIYQAEIHIISKSLIIKSMIDGVFCTILRTVCLRNFLNPYTYYTYENWNCIFPITSHRLVVYVHLFDGQLYAKSRCHWSLASAVCELVEGAEIDSTVLSTEQFQSLAHFRTSAEGNFFLRDIGDKMY